MPKDALGHGSNERGGPVAAHASGVAAIPAKSDGTQVMSDEYWHATMPPENYGGMISDLLGLWKGTQKPDPLTVSEIKQVREAYDRRDDWRGMARTIQDQRKARTA